MLNNEPIKIIRDLPPGFSNTLAQEIEAVAPICNFYHISQAQINDSDPKIVAEKANLAYDRIQLHVNLVLDLVQEIIAKSNVGQPLDINQTVAPE